jgi:hypothetical protein
MTVYTPGITIQNQAGETGALGCFARTLSGAGGPPVPVLLGCSHVLFGSMVNSTKVDINEPSNSTCSKNVRTSRTTYSWEQGFRLVRIRVDGQELSGAETDCAIAPLEPGLQFTNQIPGIGMITGTPPAGSLGVIAGPPFGSAPGPQHYVRFYSPVDKRVHHGTILKAPVFTATYLEGGSGPVDPLVWPRLTTDLSDAGKDMVTGINQILILPRPDPAEPGGYGPYLAGKSLLFGQGGDSGSVVVNSANQVIGLISRAGGRKFTSPETAVEWRAASGLGVVCPIGKVLDQMKIEIPPSFAGSVPQTGPIDLASPGARTDPDAIAMHQGIDRLRQEVSGTRLGRVILGMITRHNREVRRIVYGRRPALVAWRDNQGPALFAHLLRGLRDPSHQIPTVINGVPRTRLLQAMEAALLEFGSPQLRRDIERYRSPALRYAPAVTLLDQVPEIIAQMSRDRLRETGPGEG